jgi:2-iminobutanoate/2-iminopropanoate deaminase
LEKGRLHKISTAAAPAAAGHYAQGIAHGGLVYVSGQLPIDPATGEVVAGGVEAQTERTLRNVEAVLEAGGAGLDTLVSVTIYITSRAQWPAVNAAYAAVLGEHRPARAVIPVLELKPDCFIEIQAIAAVR